MAYLSADAIPCPPTIDQESEIRTLATYVARNGQAFEEMVKQKEVSNPKFTFLFPDTNQDGNGFYRWVLFCKQKGFTDDQILLLEDRYRQQLASADIGCIDLVYDDKVLLHDLLAQNSGSKENIKFLRKWVIDRGHSIVAISFSIFDFCGKALTNPSEVPFTKLLHAIYVVNDVLFNGGHTTTKGPYTRFHDYMPRAVDVSMAFGLVLPHIMRIALQCASTQAERDRLSRLVDLWKSKSLVHETTALLLTHLVTDNRNSTMDEPPQSPPLISPYLRDFSFPTVTHQSFPPPPNPPMFPHAPSNFSDNPSKLGLPHYPGPIATPATTVPAQGFPTLPNPSMSYPPPTSLLPLPPHIVAQMHMPMFMHAGMGMGGNTMFVPSLPIPLPPVLLDLHKISVGAMVNIVKAVLKTEQGQRRRYAPIDPGLVSQTAPPHVEPGRLDARVAEFYRKAEQLIKTPGNNNSNSDEGRLAVSSGSDKRSEGGAKSPIESRGENAGRGRGINFSGEASAALIRRESKDGDRSSGRGLDRERDQGDGYRDRHRDRSRSRERDRHRDRSGSREKDRDREWMERIGVYRDPRGGDDEDSRRDSRRATSGRYNDRDLRERAAAGPLGVAGEISSTAPMIEEDNIGHKLLLQKGWQRGSGLGADGKGIVEPVREAGTVGKAGVGSGSGLDAADDKLGFASYRQQLSSEYHTKIVDRETRRR